MNTSILGFARQPAPRVTSQRSSLSPGVWRSVLLAGCILSIAVAASIGDPWPFMQADAELALLLRGMAAIKSLLVVAAVAILLWRFGRPVRPAVAAAYLVGTWMIAGATMLIWQLSLIVPAAGLFHIGGLMLLLIALRDDGGIRRAFPIPGRSGTAR